MQDQTTFLGKKINLLHTGIVSDVAQVLLEQRHIEDMDGFLQPDYHQFHDPFLMRDMDKAVERIRQAKENNERVMIFGDYDADGVSSTAALFLYLRDDLGLQVSYRLPDRLLDGYGMKSYFIDDIKKAGATLIITVDCGTRDHDVIKYTIDSGLDIIVTDHHTPADTLPSGQCALINPHRPDCSYPFKNLSGSGVVLKLIQALSGKKDIIQKYIDICTIGTVADVMPLVGENRTMTTLGLKQMQRSRRTCFEELVPKRCHLDADFVSFQMGPLINAAGRMESPLSALNMLITNGQESRIHLRKLQQLNEQRKQSTKMYFEQAMSKINENKSLITYASDIPHGIIGLVAGKLCERYNKPIMIMANEDDHLVGSCRSPEYIHIVDVLSEHEDLFESFGGHAQAAGFTVTKDNWKKLEPLLQETVTKKLIGVDTTPTITVDMELPHNLTHLDTLKKLVALQPYGNANPKPIFLIQDIPLIAVRMLGSSGDHIKIQSDIGQIVAWGWGEHFTKLTSQKSLTIIAELSSNEWNGTTSLQIRMVDCLM